MPDRLPIILNDLLRQPRKAQAGSPDAILCRLRTFGNDFENLGGGYMVIGQDVPCGAVAGTSTRQEPTVAAREVSM